MSPSVARGEAAGELPAYAALVLELVDRIPVSRALGYGEVAAIARSLGVGGGPRQVGAVLARYGASVPWWRVIRADGRPPRGHEVAALGHYDAEGTPLRSRDPVRVDMTAAWVDVVVSADDPLWIAASSMGVTESSMGVAASSASTVRGR